MYPRKNYFAGPSKESERNWIMFIPEISICAPTKNRVRPVIIDPWTIAARMNRADHRLVCPITGDDPSLLSLDDGDIKLATPLCCIVIGIRVL